jgi:hypothetical protein
MTTPSSSRPTSSALRCGLFALLWVACGGSGNKNSPEETGRSCTPTADAAAGTCFSDLQESIKGTPICLTRVPDGYCTHTCNTDSDCCAVKGECKSGFPQVCAPFESTGGKYCFLSCEDAVISSSPSNDPNNPIDDTSYCQENANAAFICRSTGGGNQNRKVCVPNG